MVLGRLKNQDIRVILNTLVSILCWWLHNG